MNTLTTILGDGTALLGIGLAATLFLTSAATGFGLVILLGIAEMTLGVLPVLINSD